MRPWCHLLERDVTSRLRPDGPGATAPGSGVVFAELNACTPASSSPSNGVTGACPLPRQKSSPAGSANHAPTWLRSTRTRLPSTSVLENASETMSLNVLCARPLRSEVKSPMYSAAPKGAPACSSRKTVKVVLGGRPLASTVKLSKPTWSTVSSTPILTRALGMHPASCGLDGVSFSVVSNLWCLEGWYP